MTRKSPVHYIAPSAISLVPNCNGTHNDIAVTIARGTKIKVHSRSIEELKPDNGSYREWTLNGRNRRLSDYATPSNLHPYTIYARLKKDDYNDGYLIFVPKFKPTGDEWVDPCPYVAPSGVVWPENVFGDFDDYWYIRLGDVTLPENGQRSIDFDSGILGTEQYNEDWEFDPDALPLRIDLTCMIGDRELGNPPYVFWGDLLKLTANLVEGWGTNANNMVKRWTIMRNTGDATADEKWNYPDAAGETDGTETLEESAAKEMVGGQTTLAHSRAADDFGGAVAPMFTIMAWGQAESDDGSSSGDEAADPETPAASDEPANQEDPENPETPETPEDPGSEGDATKLQLLAKTVLTVLAETELRYELALSTNLVTFSPQTGEYNPAEKITVRVKAVNQRGEAYFLSTQQLTSARLHGFYAPVNGDTATELEFEDNNANEAIAPIMVQTAFAAQESLNVRLVNDAEVELDLKTIGFLRNGEDSRMREWIYRRCQTLKGYGTLPSQISQGAVSPSGVADGTVTDKNQDEWVPNGWTDEPEGVTEDMPYEYSAFREYVYGSDSGNDGEESQEDAANGHWGDFSAPVIFSHYGQRGTPGDTPLTAFRWYKEGLTPTAPSDTSRDEPIVSNQPEEQGNVSPANKWSATAPNRPGDGWNLWMTQSVKHTAANGIVTRDAWSVPVRISGEKGTPGEDAGEREWIYAYQSTGYDGNRGHIGGEADGTDTNKNQDDWVPNGWRDNPKGVTRVNPEEWASWRDVTTDGGTKTYGAFHAPILWSHYGRNGIDGDGVEYAYIRTTTETAPEIDFGNGGTYDNELYMSSNQSLYNEDEFLPVAHVSGGNVEPNAVANGNNGGGISGGTPGMFGECTDDPRGVSPQWPYEWVAKRTKADPDAASGERIWNPYQGFMALWSKWSADGKNAVRADIDNQSDVVSLDSDGLVRFNRAVTVRLRLFEGSTVVTAGVTKDATLTAANLAIGDCTPMVSDVIGGVVIVTWNFTKGMAGVTGCQRTLALTYNGQTYSTEFSLATTDAAAIYQLLPSRSELAFGVDSSNNFTPATQEVYCGYVKYDGNGPKVFPGNVRDNLWHEGGAPYNIMYRQQKADGTYTWKYWSWAKDLEHNEEYDGTLRIPSSTQLVAVEFILTSATGADSVPDDSIIDREIVPIIKSGKQGANADTPLTAFRWYKESLTPVTPTDVTKDEPEPASSDHSGADKVFPTNEWRSSAPNRPGDGWHLWMTQSVKHTAADRTVTRDAWSAPVRISGEKGTPGEDGDNREWIYNYSANGYDGKTGHVGDSAVETTDKNQDDWVPDGWSDQPRGVDSMHTEEWASWRDITTDGGTKTYGAFHAPILWSHYGRNGVDGDGMEYVFIRSNSNAAPVIPTSGPYVDTDYTDSNGQTYTADEHLPRVTANTNIESGNSGNGNKPYECTDEPKGVKSEWRYEWMAKRTKGPADATTGVRTWQPYAGAMSLWAHWSADGKNAVRLDIDNQADAVACDSQGKVRFRQVVTVRARVYDGGTQVTADVQQPDTQTAASLAIGDVVPQVTLSGGVLTVTWEFLTTHTLQLGTQRVNVALEYANTAYSAVFSLTTSDSAAIYQLLPSQDKLSFALDQETNSLQPASQQVYCGYTKVESSGTIPFPGNVVEDGRVVNTTNIGGLYNIFYRYVSANGTASQWYWAKDLSAGTLTIASNTQYKAVEFALSSANGWGSVADGNIIDREVVPILKDGINGTSGSSPIVADISNEMFSVACDSDGHVTLGPDMWDRDGERIYGVWHLQAVMSMYNGAEPLQLTAPLSVDGAENLWHCFTDPETGTVDIWIAEGDADDPNDVLPPTTVLTVTGQANVNNAVVQRQKTITINAVMAGVNGANGVSPTVYDLMPSMSQISVGRAANGDFSPATVEIKCGYKSIRAGEVKNYEEYSTFIENKYALFFRRRNRSDRTWTGYLYYSIDNRNRYLSAFDVTAYDKVEFLLYHTNINALGTPVPAYIIDRETVPVVADGAAGADGASQPYYTETQEAWSNDVSTASPETPPMTATNIANNDTVLHDEDWSRGTPVKPAGMAYLWRRSRLCTYDSTAQAYTVGVWSYNRLSGTNGTSIEPRGGVKMIVAANGALSTQGMSVGDLALKQGDATPWRYTGSAWSQNGQTASGDGDCYVVTANCNYDADGDGTAENVYGYMFMWSSEASRWISLGQFKGDAGVTYYTHVAWAEDEDVTLSSSQLPIPAGQKNRPNATAVESATVSPSANGLPWMGILIDQQVDDSTEWTKYTWNYVKGAVGDNALRLDLDNETEVILYDNEGRRVSGAVTSQAVLYDGQRPVPASEVTWSLGSVIGTTDVNNGSAQAHDAPAPGGDTACWITDRGLVTVNGLTATDASVLVRAAYGGQVRTAKLTMKKQVGGNKYDVIATPSAIPANLTSDPKVGVGTQLTVRVWRTGTDGLRANIDELPTGFHLKRYITKTDGKQRPDDVNTDRTANYNANEGYIAYTFTETMLSEYSAYRFELTDADGNVLDSETVPINKAADGTPGAAGQNAMRLDLDNESEVMLYDSEGNRVSGAVTSQARLYNGAEPVASGVTWSISQATGVTLKNDGAQTTDTFSGATDCWINPTGRVVVNGITATDAVITVCATYNNKKYYTTLNLHKQIGGSKYDLLVTPNSIGYNTSSGPATTTVTATVKRTAVDSGQPVTALPPTGYRLMFCVTDSNGRYMPATDSAGVSGDKGQVSSASFATRNNTMNEVRVVIAKLTATGVVDESSVLDSETVPILKVQNGTAGQTTAILDLDNQMDALLVDDNNVVTMDRTVTVNAAIYNGGSRELTGVTAPTPESLQVIYYDSDDVPQALLPTVSVTDGLITITWQFTAGMRITGERITKYVAVNFNGTPYEKPFTMLLLKGNALYQIRPKQSSVAFGRNSDNSLNPASVTVGFDVEKITSSGMTLITAQEACATGAGTQIIFRMVKADGTYCYPNGTQIEKGTNKDNDRTNDWCWLKSMGDGGQENPQYTVTVDGIRQFVAMEVAIIDYSSSHDRMDVPESLILDKEYIPIIYAGANGAPGQPGDPGLPGKDAPYNDYEYAIFDSRAVNREGVPTGKQGSPWQPQALPTTDDHPYLWQRIKHFTSAGVNDSTSYVCLTGPEGRKGDTGKACYLVGEYRDDVVYTSNDYQTVAVEVPVEGSTEVRIFYLNAPTNVVNGMHVSPTTEGQTVWVEGLNKYNLIRTSYLFADYANLGSGIVNKDFFFSMHGEKEVTLWNTGWAVPTDGKYNRYGNFTFPVQNGAVYTLLIDCKVSVGAIMLRAYYQVGETFTLGEERLTVTAGDRQTVAFVFKAERTGNATLYAWATTEATAYIYSVKTQTTASYREMSPTFVNTDEQVIIDGISGNYEIPCRNHAKFAPVLYTQIFLVQGQQYTLHLSAKVETTRKIVSFQFVKTTDETPIANDGITSVYSTNYPDTPTDITFTAAYTGYVMLAAKVSEENVRADVNYASVTPVNPFVPKTAIDMFSGYAHFSGDRVRFNPDGSGKLAGGNIKWTAEGDTEVNGTVKAQLFYSPMRDIESGQSPYVVNPKTNGTYLYVTHPKFQQPIEIHLPQPEDFPGLELRFFSMSHNRGSGLITTLICEDGKIALDQIDGWKKYDTFILPRNYLINIVSLGDVWAVLNNNS